METGIGQHAVQKQKNFFLILLLTLLLSCSFTQSYALVFTIVPNGALPTKVPLGGTVTASYVVTNNTGMQRNNNFVKYLPPNVSVGGGGVDVQAILIYHLGAIQVIAAF